MSAADPNHAIGTIDHVVIVVNDLAEGADTYRRLGFTLSPKGLHSAAMGTANHTIMLQNDYFELLGVLAPTEQNTRWRQTRDEGGGIAGIALTTKNADAAKALWQHQNLSPGDVFHFSRAVTRADGTQLEARFALVSLQDVPLTGVRIFVCSQPTREAVWLPELMAHPNTAQAITKVTFACADPAAVLAQLHRVLPASKAVRSDDGFIIRLTHHELELADRERAETRFGLDPTPMDADARPVAIAYRVADLRVTQDVLRRNGVGFISKDGALHVSRQEGCNVALTFLTDA